MEDLEYQREYRVLKRKTYTLGQSYPGFYDDISSTTYFPAHSSQKPYKAFRWRVPINKVVTWAENSAYPLQNEVCFYIGGDDPRQSYINHDNFNFQLLTWAIYFQDK